jgi:hypothetical protein
MVKVLRKEQMKLLMKDIILMVRNMVKVYWNIQMDHNIKEIFLMDNMMELVNILGMMVEYMEVNGKIIKWMVKESIDIQMEINILVWYIFNII